MLVLSTLAYDEERQILNQLLKQQVMSIKRIFLLVLEFGPYYHPPRVTYMLSLVLLSFLVQLYINNATKSDD